MIWTGGCYFGTLKAVQSHELSSDTVVLVHHSTIRWHCHACQWRTDASLPSL